MSRSADLEGRLRAVRRQIETACERTGRDPQEVTLVAVAKTFPAEDIRIVAELGQRDIGENRDQEAAPKVAQLADLDLCWHFVGQLQTNKARSVASYADVVHSVDRPHLVVALSHAATELGRSIDVFVQVSLDETDRPGRGGVPPEAAPALADLVAGAAGLELVGVMGIAPLGQPPGPAFARLARVRDAVVDVHPSASAVSAGMSGDLDEAIAAGATHVRVGTALFGDRKRLLR